MSNYDPNQPGQPYDPSAGGNGSTPNPYGQSPYGQNPYGQAPQPQVPGFDQHQQQGGYAPVQPPTERPKTLQWAFLLILLAGVLNAIGTWLISNVHLISNIFRAEWPLVQEQLQLQLDSAPDDPMNVQMQQLMENPDTFLREVDSIMASASLVGIVISLVAYFLVGYFVGRGVNALRIIATIFAVFSLISLATSLPMVSLYANASDVGMLNMVLILSALAGVAGVVFSWLPASSKYIAQRKMARRAGFR